MATYSIYRDADTSEVHFYRCLDEDAERTAEKSVCGRHKRGANDRLVSRGISEKDIILKYLPQTVSNGNYLDVCGKCVAALFDSKES